MKTGRITAAVTAFALSLFASITADAQKHTVSGYVTDAASGEPLIGVAVMDAATGLGTVTSNSGYYSISLEDAAHTLKVIYLGYEEKSVEVELTGNLSLNIRISESSDILTGSVVTASRSVTGALGTQMSAIEVPVNQIRAIPAIGGEVDVIKALQLLPGVQSGSEGTAGMYVRGGGADENLLLMDGVPLYNVNHMLGFFSVFNADAVKNVTLYKGSFPARFGGHLSSVVDVRMNDGNDSELHGNASIGLISSKFNLEGPIVKGKTTFNVSARRTYLDLLAKPAIAIINKRHNSEDSDYRENHTGGYDFYDLNAKITHRFNNNDRLSLSIYGGDDEASVGMDIEDRIDHKSWSREAMDFGLKWGNFVSALRWSHEINPKLYLVSGANCTRYRNNLSVNLLEASGEVENRKKTETASTEANLGYNSFIKDIALTEDFEWRPNPLHDVKFGAGYTYHTFRPSVITIKADTRDDESPLNNLEFSQTVGDEKLFTHEAALYGEDNWSVTGWLKANLGVRASMYNVSGKTYLSLEPRVSARALIADGFSFKLSYTEMSQYIHLLSTSSLSLPSDLWVPVTKSVKPMRSRQTAAGFFYDLGQFELSVEGYWKDMDNVLEYKDGASYMGTSTGWEEKVSMGRGWACGLEFLVQKKTGKTTGWIGYTLAKSMRQFDRPGNVINNGEPFPAKYDRRHDLSATITHAFSKKFDVSATFVYASGNCGSLGFDEYQAYVLTGGGSGSSFRPEGSYLEYLPYRNNYRMPAYNRMDIGMNFYHPHKKRGTGIWNISVYNVYNRQNPYLLLVEGESYFDEATQNMETRQVLKQLSIFPIIPSFSYTYKF